MQIASFGKTRRQGGSSITFVQVRPEFCISGLEYRYIISGIGTEFQHWNPGIGTARRINLVSILGNAYRYPSPFMELEYRYWLPSTDIGCLKTAYGVLRSMILYVLVPELVVYDFMNCIPMTLLIFLFNILNHISYYIVPLGLGSTTVEVTGGFSTLLTVYLQTDLECRVRFESWGLVLIWSLTVDWVLGLTSSVRHDIHI
ncbi:hypothetical protein GQ457_06G010230 [Hibiscus cannabinus]